MSTDQSPQIVAVAWYSPITWTAVRSIVADPESLEASYEAWCAVFEQGLHTLAEARIHAVCVPIDVDGYLAWCRQHQHALDSGGRAGYAAELLRRQYEGSGAKRGA